MMPAVVFDVGNVLIDVDYDSLRQYLIDNGVSARSQDDFFRAIRLIDYECGKLSCSEFIRSIRGLLENAVSEDELAERWSSIFTPADEMLDLLAQIRALHPVYLFSNTNELHWKYLNKHYALEKLVHGVVVSCRAGAMKPDPRIYRYLMDEFGLAAKDIIFLDDRLENVTAANDLGWTAIQHFSSFDTRQKLLNLGVNIPIRSDPIQ